MPTEEDEQIAVVTYCRARQLVSTSVPNSTYTTSWSQKAKNARLGLVAGFPDLIVLIAPGQSHDGLGYLLCIEMKRRKGGTLSEQQRRWIAALSGLQTPHVVAAVCKGAPEGIAVIDRHLARPAEVF